MKLLLTHSYFLRLDAKQWATGQPYAPLGTLYAAAFMRENGYPVSFFDTMFSYGPDEIIAAIENEYPDVFIIYDDGFNYLTKMCLENMRDAAFEMIRYAKKKGCTVIVSSSDSTDRYELYLNKDADYILLGEAEQSLLELTTALNKNRAELFGIEGLAFKHNGAVVKTTRRKVLKNLDSLPFPAWDLIDMKPYKKMWLKNTGRFSMNMGTTRGCPFKCNWCAKPIYGNRYNSRSPLNVVKELKMLKAAFGFDHIWFCDDIFGLTPGWIKEFADLIEQENLSFTFKMQARVDLLLLENNILDLKRAGCENIWMGAESGSQKILDAMDKGTTVQQIYEATHLLKKCEINPSFFIQFGYLTETKEDIAKTVHMINELLPHEIGISVSYPLPGTVFFEKVKSQLTQKTNWKDSDELALMFTNTYQPAFYKQLHRYVHKSYRQHMALENIKQLFEHPFKTDFYRIKKSLSALYYMPAAFIDKQRLKKLEKPAHVHAC
ncbi:MAG: B12-binding domain-containing radical SAM protein [Chitinophagaceae bacterium]|nr:B12-binding domain-containing radical SAM protein [Chitinophagaceae bacterium]